MADPTWKRALVTGASSGIGEEFARQLAAAGTDLVLVARSVETLETLAGELRERHGVDADVVPADLTDPGDLERIEGRVRDAAAPIDLLVNNAGIGSTGRFTEQEHDRVDAQVKLNVGAVTRLTHAALPGMIGRGSGGIVNVASIASFQPIPRFAVYAASKAYVRSFSEAIHEELQGTGVHVTALCPGFTRTNFPEAAGAEDDATKIPGFIWMEPGPVVAAGLKGIASNRAVVVPGIQYKASASASSILPSGVTRRIIALANRVTGLD